MTRGDVMYLARLYSQVPATAVSDTAAYKLQDQEEIRMYGEAARRAPSLMMVTQDIPYAGGSSAVPPTTPIYRLVNLGEKQTGTGNGFLFLRRLSTLQFNELECPNVVNSWGTSRKFHWNGTRIFVRPIPSEAITLTALYVPKLTPGTSTSSSIFAGNETLDVFGEYLAVRVAARLRQLCGRDASALLAQAAEQDKDFMDQVQKLQDAEPAHVANTSLYVQGSEGVGASYTGDEW